MKLTAEEAAAVLLMVLIVTSLIIAWASLLRRPRKVHSDLRAREQLSWSASPKVEERHVAAARQTPRQQSPVREDKRPSEIVQQKKSMPDQQRVVQPPSPQSRASLPENSSHYTSNEKQSNTGGEAEQKVREDASKKIDIEESEQPEDIARLESMLTDTKKLFAVLLEEYEKLRELID
ncbi:MAG: hypothetical protein QXQ33_03210 [Nitrososphaerota archaeon]